MNRTTNQSEYANILGLMLNSTTGLYSYDELRSYCFNTTSLHGIGVELWEEDDDWEMINWYFKLEKCHGRNSCASEDEINDYVENLIVTNKIKQPALHFNLESEQWN